ncbi:hypothetical protein BO94DRAFT_4542 [Aspergillus sclerotioniger CBS 115572]|uniref:LYR motif-containing protein Cup1-like N-terminal domain-containing protein n=1 Tax=Aspergillus sclerotioniger CBS 115572 TaxID=1450535 RepID=A0A317XEZ0_9EURO|nr:hypothetical protein BO94DRAFT_4542 [Aspergillus sclerotioniger CBS 115572]PWY96277.1 hypothetical protein BO94DRAFT_4542 [Aspergillus sclerotioniger CBS 115572]
MSSPRIPVETWRHLLRALLRECSYLPDPVARVNMHAHTLDRYRRYVKKKPDLIRQIALHKSALQELSLLRRANEGYSKPLEKVLQLAYGRRGKRRQDLIDKFITPSDAVDALDPANVQPLVGQFKDGWRPPSLMVDLLKAQRHNAMITLLNAGYHVKEIEPVIPNENVWGRPLAQSRRINIRREWYVKARSNMFPPLPDAELDTLDGLISGATPWTPPKRRKAVGTAPFRNINVALFLIKGPSKGDTFEKYVDGRPHNITRRFMTRLWKRVSCLVPRVNWNSVTKRPTFSWDVIHTNPQLALSTDEENAWQIFDGIDDQGKKIKEVEPRNEPQQSD